MPEQEGSYTGHVQEGKRAAPHRRCQFKRGNASPISSGGKNMTCISEENKRRETKEWERTPVALLGDEP